MGVRQAVRELQENNQELRKQHRLRVLRRILKPLLVGFFIGKDAERKISELTTTKGQIIDSIDKLLSEELETIGKQVKEIMNSDTYLTHTDAEQCFAKLRSIEEELQYLETSKALEEEFVSSKKEELEKYRRLQEELGRIKPTFPPPQYKYPVQHGKDSPTSKTYDIVETPEGITATERKKEKVKSNWYI